MKIILKLENEQERRAFLVPEDIRYFAGIAKIHASNYFARQFMDAPILLTVEIDGGKFCSEIPLPRLPG